MRGYSANAAEILPLQRPARTLLPPLLFCMACEVLHVRLLAPEVRNGCSEAGVLKINILDFGFDDIWVFFYLHQEVLVLVHLVGAQPADMFRVKKPPLFLLVVRSLHCK